jgi:hypothetical protein
MLKIKEKTEIMTIEEIRACYPKEWVIIADPESDYDFNVMGGKVLAHSPERELIDRALMEYAQVQSLAIEYTGLIPDDYAVML